ncbi:DnaD domain protein [Enterococcus nangangensis]|uniref:DnaD domain protein n=1 Tax=Enterococcus nangangensis TaxID=2559926 RepID=UPI0010F8D672|nr:DnaD domain protein [Enterococcus nangangensis]
MLNLTSYLALGQTTLSNGLLDYYHELGLTDAQCLLLIQLFRFQQAGDFFPAPEVLSQKTGKGINEIYQLLSQLQEKNCLTITTYQDQHKMKYDRYDLTLIFATLEKFLAQKKATASQKQQQGEQQKLFQMFQQEFGRNLSPFELETVTQWLEVDHYSVELIQLALKEAVLNQAFSLKYMDRILLSWQKKNITTKGQVQVEQERHQKEIDQKKAQQTNTEVADLPEIPFVPWAKGTEEGQR